MDTLASTVLIGKNPVIFVLNSGLCSHTPSDWSTKEYKLAGVIFPLTSAAPPFRAWISNSVNTPWPVIPSSMAASSRLLAVKIVTPFPIIASGESIALKSPNFPE